MHDVHRAVIVAVLSVRVMQVAADEIVGMVAVRHRLMAAAGAVLMSGLVRFARVSRSAVRRVDPRNRQRVLIHVISVPVVQMAVVQVVHVPVVPDRGVPAAGAIYVRVPLMDRMKMAVSHESSRYLDLPRPGRLQSY